MIPIKKIFPFFILINTFVSVNQWSRIPLGNTFSIWALDFVTIGIILWYKRLYFYPSNKKDYVIVELYFGWMLLGVIRGMFVAEGYWEWKCWVESSLDLSLPIFVYVFSIPNVLHKVLKIWLKYALPAFFFFFIWVTSWGSKHYYLGPILFLSCFLPILKRKWQLIFIGLLLLMLFASFGARSQVIKSVAALLISLAYLASKYLTDKILKISHWVLYLATIILLYLGISGTFNIFEGLASNDGKYVEHTVENGEIVDDDLSADTRSFIYEEVINSAIKNHYVLCGRTPARGNDSPTFGTYNAEVLGTGKYERHDNEVCFTNVFTWIGLIGILLYCLIYLKSSYLAVYKSNNIFIKLVGLFIAFRFLYGWIEDFNRFDIANISLWMMIAMGFSEEFRNMNDDDFKQWVRSIF